MWPDILKFERKNRAEPIDGLMGIPIDSSRELSLIHVIDQLIIPNGYSIFRKSTIAKTSEDPSSKTLGVALELKGFLPPGKPAVELQSMKKCLASIHRQKFFVSVFFEFDRPDVAYLGEVVQVDKETFRLKWVSPSAAIGAKTTAFRIADCTRVDFAGEYERAMQLASIMLASKANKRSR